MESARLRNNALQTDNLIAGSSSTVPFSKAECEELLRLLKHTDRRLSVMSEKFLLLNRAVYSGSSPSKTVFLAWILEEICGYNEIQAFNIVMAL